MMVYNNLITITNKLDYFPFPGFPKLNFNQDDKTFKDQDSNIFKAKTRLLKQDFKKSRQD